MSEAPKYKSLLFIVRNPDLTPAEFKDYYENHHPQLIWSLMATLKAHGIDERSTPILCKRRYIDHDSADPKLGNPGTTGADLPPIECDVITEVVFQRKELAEGCAKVLYEIEENATKLTADEEKMIDRGKMRALVFEEFVSAEPLPFFRNEKQIRRA